MTELEEGKKYRLIDYSESDFIAWNLEREKHLQTIEHLKARVNELASERDMWMREASKTVVHFDDR